MGGGLKLHGSSSVLGLGFWSGFSGACMTDDWPDHLVREGLRLEVMSWPEMLGVEWDPEDQTVDWYVDRIIATAKRLARRHG